MSTALLLIDHGSKRQEANDMLMKIVANLQEKRPDLILEGAHMELATPTIEEGIRACIKKGATKLIVHPYMLAPGRHATTDIPNMVNESMKQHDIPYSITDPIGIDDLILELILKRAKLN